MKSPEKIELRTSAQPWRPRLTKAEMMAPRPLLKDVKVKASPKGHGTKVLTIGSRTAALLRRVAKADGLQMTVFLDRCLRAYLEKYHPDWETVDS